MSECIEMDINEISSARTEMEKALNTFKEFMKNGFKEEVEMLDSMNADFTSKLQKVLNEIDTKSITSLIEKYEELIAKETEVSDTLVETDEEISLEFEAHGGQA